MEISYWEGRGGFKKEMKRRHSDWDEGGRGGKHTRRGGEMIIGKIDDSVYKCTVSM